MNLKDYINMEHISKIIDDISQQVITPIETGIAYFDTAIGGYYPGEVTTICGEECCCKTAFVIHQVCHIAIDQKIPTLVLLNYISERNFLSSLIAYYCNIEPNNIHHILESGQYKETVEVFLSKLKESPLYIMKASWYEDKITIDNIGKYIDANSIKIIFIDEVILDLSPDVAAGFCSIGTIAVKKNIPIVVTCYIWNDREGIEGIRPWLTDVSKRSYMHGHDVVIGFTNYEQHRVFMDDRGLDLHGMIGIEILKHRGKVKEKYHYIPKDYLFFRDYEKRKQQILENIKETGGEVIGSLIEKFKLTIEEGDSLSL